MDLPGIGKDLLQLVGPRVSLWDPMQDKVFDEAAVRGRFGVDPDRLVDYFALVGDSADNIPGVTGVGPKTAQRLLSEHGTLEGVYEALPEMPASKLKERLVAQRDRAFLSRDLVRLKTDLDVPEDLAAYQRQAPDQEALRRVFTELSFASLLRSETEAKAVDHEGFVLVRDRRGLAEVVEALEGARIVVLDTETTSLTRILRLLALGTVIWVFWPPPGFARLRVSRASSRRPRFFFPRLAWRRASRSSLLMW